MMGIKKVVAGSRNRKREKKMRLIDADDLLERMKFFKDSGGYTNWELLAFEMVDASPTVDTERHGHWISLYPCEEPITNLFKCSVCGMGYEDDDTDCQVYFEWDYCPHCGAKMDEVE